MFIDWLMSSTIFLKGVLLGAVRRQTEAFEENFGRVVTLEFCSKQLKETKANMRTRCKEYSKQACKNS
jgi:hypothetical protein